jgi:hypothetical protein
MLVGGVLVVAATSFAKPPESEEPRIDHRGEVDNPALRPPGILVEAANLAAKLEQMVDPDAPCPDGPCLGGDVITVARAALDRCAKIGGAEFSKANPALDPQDPLVVLDQVVSVTCEELRVAMESAEPQADRAMAVARNRAPEMRTALAAADESFKTP